MSPQCYILLIWFLLFVFFLVLPEGQRSSVHRQQCYIFFHCCQVNHLLVPSLGHLLNLAGICSASSEMLDSGSSSAVWGSPQRFSSDGRRTTWPSNHILPVSATLQCSGVTLHSIYTLCTGAVDLLPSGNCFNDCQQVEPGVRETRGGFDPFWTTFSRQREP